MSIFRRLTHSRWFWFVLASAVVGITAASIFPTDTPPSSSAWVEPETPREAPNFTLDRLNGDTFALEEYRGQVVVLNFWATWCPPCRKEIPDFVRMQRDLGDEGLQFVGVALERSAGPDEVRAFAEKMNINYPIGLGTGSIAQKYGGVRGLPMTFVIGPDGAIRGRIPGRTTESRLRPALETLLEESS
jgi:cytochrome c biogenesis protein CcmG/thiol:disulfide interchange protein DsbE